mmetsp:Transcript_286/g.521  ORF Transcript_286/g.521 Transcript_286/m.521 type:complete len:104 (-) Transcript_286:70-381(-)
MLALWHSERSLDRGQKAMQMDDGVAFALRVVALPSIALRVVALPSIALWDVEEHTTPTCRQIMVACEGCVRVGVYKLMITWVQTYEYTRCMLFVFYTTCTGIV